MRAPWRHFRTDLFGVAFLALATACLATARWQVLAIFALGAALFCAISPRMKGPFGFSSGTARFGGTFEDALNTFLKEQSSEPDQRSPAEDAPSSKGPSED
jgi:hypothetical protein